MNLSTFGVKRPVTITLLVVVVIVMGMISAKRLGVDLLPDLDFPVITVITSYQGVSPEEIENQITRRIEEMSSSVQNVKHVYSTSEEGLSIVTTEFEWGVNVDEAASDLRDKLDFMKRFLPDDAEKPIVMKFDPSFFPVTMISFYGRKDEISLRRYVDDVIVPQLERVPGVASAFLFGGRESEILISVDRRKLEAFNIPLMQIIQTVRYENLDVTGGRVTERNFEYIVKSKGEFKNVRDFEKIVITTKTGKPIYLKDIAEIKDTFKEIRDYSRTDFQSSTTVGIQKESEANTVQVVDAVNEKMKELQKELPPDIKTSVGFDQSAFIRKSSANLRSNLLMGAFLAVVVVFFFLGSIRSSIIIGFTIPVSVIFTMIPLYFMGFTLNAMSMGGLAIAVGMLVDNSIVVLENITRRMQKGEDPVKASEVGTKEVGMAITASTLTTIVVFLPIAYTKGMAAKIFSELAWSITFSLVASLIVALTLMPMLTSRFVHYKAAVAGGNNGKGAFVKISNVYGRILSQCLKMKALIIIGAFVLLILTGLLVPRIGSELMGKSDEGEFIINIKMDKGTRLEETNRVVGLFEREMDEMPYVEHVSARVGTPESSAGFSAGFGGSEEGAHTGSVMVKLVPASERKGVDTKDLIDMARKRTSYIKGVEARYRTMMQFMGRMGQGVSIDIYGSDIEKLKGISNEVSKRIENVEGVRDLKTSLTEGAPEIQIVYNRDRMAAFGLTVGQVANTVRASLHGDIASIFRVGDKEHQIRVRYSDDTRFNIEDVRNVVITTPLGKQIRLRDVAEVQYGTGPSRLERKDRTRLAKVEGDVADRPLGDVIADIKVKIADLNLPQGYQLEFGGEYEQMRDVFTNMMLALVLSIFLVYVVMASQFESFLHPFVIMMTLPLAGIGVLLAMFLTGTPLSLFAFLGIIMLVGVVVNNGIVLIDYINQLMRNEGMERREAVVLGAKTRLRPVLMTAMTTIIAMIPLAMGIGEGAETRQPMGIAFIGGMITSTFLTLIIIPIMFMIFDPIGERFASIRERLSSKKVESSAQEEE